MALFYIGTVFTMYCRNRFCVSALCRPLTARALHNRNMYWIPCPLILFAPPILVHVFAGIEGLPVHLATSDTVEAMASPYSS